LERERVPDNAKREYDAEFLDVAAGLYFDPQCVDAVVSDYQLEEEYNPRWAYAAGADFGFSHDSSALVVVCFDGESYRVVSIIELKPEGVALKPSKVVDVFAHVIKRYHLHHVVSDIHYREAIRELLSKHNIDLISAPEGRAGKIESYARAKSMMYDQKTKVPNHRRLVQQMKEIKQRPVSGGGLSIESPRKQSGHGDIVSAWVLAMWRLTYMTIHDVQYRDLFMFGAPYRAPDYKKEMELLEKYSRERYGSREKEDW
jgi:phage FluMu gp28-like protein